MNFRETRIRLFGNPLTTLSYGALAMGSYFLINTKIIYSEVKDSVKAQNISINSSCDSIPKLQSQFERDINDLYLPSIFLFTIGLGGLAMTFGGKETYETYKRTKNIIKDARDKGIDPSKRINFNPPYYCDRKGLELALKEAGLDSSKSQR